MSESNIRYYKYGIRTFWAGLLLRISEKSGTSERSKDSNAVSRLVCMLPLLVLVLLGISYMVSIMAPTMSKVVGIWDAQSYYYLTVALFVVILVVLPIKLLISVVLWVKETCEQGYAHLQSLEISK